MSVYVAVATNRRHGLAHVGISNPGKGSLPKPIGTIGAYSALVGGLVRTPGALPLRIAIPYKRAPIFGPILVLLGLSALIWFFFWRGLRGT